MASERARLNETAGTSEVSPPQGAPAEAAPKAAGSESSGASDLAQAAGDAAALAPSGVAARFGPGTAAMSGAYSADAVGGPSGAPAGRASAISGSGAYSADASQAGAAAASSSRGAAGAGAYSADAGSESAGTPAGRVSALSAGGAYATDVSQAGTASASSGRGDAGAGAYEADASAAGSACSGAYTVVSGPAAAPSRVASAQGGYRVENGAFIAGARELGGPAGSAAGVAADGPAAPAENADAPLEVPAVLRELLDLKLRVTTTPFEEAERVKQLGAVADGFVERTSDTAQGIAHAYHAAKHASYAGAASRPGRAGSAAEAMATALAAMRPDGSLRLVSGGLAGGVKVADDRDGAFFKISEDQHGIYGGSPVMADKPAKHELAALSHVHDVVNSLHVTAPLVSCVDVTVRGGGEPRAYRVQAFSLLPIDSSTLRLGSEDGMRTSHVCGEWVPAARSIAEAFHLAPSARQPSTGVVHAHAHTMTVAGRDPERVIDCGEAAEAVLTSLGVGRDAESSSGLCASVEAEQGAVLDPFVAVSSCHERTSGPLPELLAGGERVQAALEGLVEGPDLRGPLPFDVEGHMLPTGERCLADTHRLCIPDVPERTGASQVFLLSGGELESFRMESENASLIEGESAQRLGVSGPPDTDEDFPGCGVRVMKWTAGRAEELVAVVGDPALYWRAPHLTALFPPRAADVLREDGVAPVSPDDAALGGPGLEALRGATRSILRDSNLELAAGAVIEAVVDHKDGETEDPTKLRARVKAGLHSRGLGLRHVLHIWERVRDFDTPEAGHNETALLAMFYSCFPRPGSSAGLALEKLIRSGTEGRLWTSACVGARFAAAKSRGVPAEVRDKFFGMWDGSEHVYSICKAWLDRQEAATVSVKSAGFGREGSQASRVERGYAAGKAQDSLRLTLWREVRHRQHTGNGGEGEPLSRLATLCGLTAARRDEGILSLWRLACLGPASAEAMGRIARALSMSGHAGAAALVAEAGVRLGGGGADALENGQAPGGDLESTSGESGWLRALEERRTALAASGGPTGPEYAEATRDLASHLAASGEHDRAAPLLEECLAIETESLGESHPALATTMLALATSQMASGEHIGPRRLIERCRRIQAESLGTSHPDYATTLQLLAAWHHTIGDPKPAIKLLEECRTIRALALGKTHPDYATTMIRLGASLAANGLHTRAVKALRVGKELLGPSPAKSNPDFATLLHGMASCHHAQGEHGLAVEMLEQCCAVRASVLGTFHLDYAESRDLMASALLALDKLDEAIAAYEESLAIREAVLSVSGPRSASTRVGLARALQAKGECARAADLYEASKWTLQRLLEEDQPPEYATLLHNMACCQASLGKDEAALELHRECVAVSSRASCRPNPEIARSLVVLANRSKDEAMAGWDALSPWNRRAVTAAAVRGGTRGPEARVGGAAGSHFVVPAGLLDSPFVAFAARSSPQVVAGRFAEAAKLYECCRRIQRSLSCLPPAEHAELLTSLATCASFGRGDTAAQLTGVLEECRDVLASSPEGTSHPSYATALFNLASCARAAGDSGRAAELSGESRRLRASLLGESHPRYQTALRLYAACSQESGDIDRAIELFEECRRIRSEADDTSSGDYAAVTESLASCWVAKGDNDRALTLLEEWHAIKKATASAGLHPDAGTLKQLAKCRHASGDHDGAIRLLNGCVSDWMDISVAWSPDANEAFSDLVSYLTASGDRAAIAELRGERRLRNAGLSGPATAQPGAAARIQLEEL